MYVEMICDMLDYSVLSFPKGVCGVEVPRPYVIQYLSAHRTFSASMLGDDCWPAGPAVPETKDMAPFIADHSHFRKFPLAAVDEV